MQAHLAQQHRLVKLKLDSNFVEAVSQRAEVEQDRRNNLRIPVPTNIHQTLALRPVAGRETHRRIIPASRQIDVRTIETAAGGTFFEDDFIASFCADVCI